VHRKGQQRLFNICAITEGSFMGREGEELVSTWAPPKVMKRIQMLGAYEQVGFSDALTRCGFAKARLAYGRRVHPLAGGLRRGRRAGCARPGLRRPIRRQRHLAATAFGLHFEVPPERQQGVDIDLYQLLSFVHDLSSAQPQVKAVAQLQMPLFDTGELYREVNDE
jgi:hypothetical protein